MDEAKDGPRKRGRPAGRQADTCDYHVWLDHDTAEWAKKQPGGLSPLLRRLLREEYERTHQGSEELPQD